MAKVIKYGDTTKIETDFKQAPVGLYVLKCESVEQKQSKNDEPMVEVIFTPVKDANGKKLKERYGRLWFYAPLDPEASWARRLKDLVTAFGLKPKAGNLGAIEGKECLGRLKEDTDLDGNYRPNIGKLLPLQQVEPEEDEDDELEADEEEEEASENGALDDLTRAELKAYIKENGLEVKVLRAMSDDDIRAAIAEQMVDEEEEEEEDLEEEEDEEEVEEEALSDNYENLSVAELRRELSDRELDTKGKRTVLIARLRTDDVEEPV